MNDVVKELTIRHKTIATMESCTGGGVANAITNIAGASEVLHFSAVTYSNDFKIKMGVPAETLAKYTVYSMETAEAMSKAIANFANTNYGIGITGKLNRVDKNNLVGDNNLIYVSIYDCNNNKYYNKIITATESTRSKNKELIIKNVIALLLEILEG